MCDWTNWNQISNDYPIYIVDCTGYEKLGFNYSEVESMGRYSPLPISPDLLPKQFTPYVFDSNVINLLLTELHLNVIFNDDIVFNPDSYMILVKPPLFRNFCFNIPYEFICIRIPDSHKDARYYNNLETLQHDIMHSNLWYDIDTRDMMYSHTINTISPEMAEKIKKGFYEDGFSEKIMRKISMLHDVYY